MRGILTPLWFVLCTMTFGGKGLHTTSAFRSLQQRNKFDYPLQNSLSKTLLSAISRKQKGTFDDEHRTGGSSKIKIKSFTPRTKNQIDYVNWMRDDGVDIIVAIGPAGTGKTMLACYAAVEALRLGKIQKIIITRPVVSVDEEIGFLPGNVESKMDPWTRPIFDVLRETYSAKEMNQMIEDGILEIVPLGFMRGRTFKNTWIVADEMQNSTPTQMLMLATRIGEDSKMVITGDLNQSDRTGPNGLQEIFHKIQNADSVEFIKAVVLDTEDVQRSRAAKAVLELYGGASSSPVVPETSFVDAADSFMENKDVVNANTSCEIEWVELSDNDAALIPRKHYYPTRKIN